MCLAPGILMIFLAVSGNASTAPGFQKSFGRWLTARSNAGVIVLHLTGVIGHGSHEGQRGRRSR